MTFEEARSKAIELNKNGKHNHDWFYYPTAYDGEWPRFAGHYFVMRRVKSADLRVAIYVDGSISGSEN